ncbi:MAG: bifunctional ornithine acetyltransferase/N-acetylglutamate synthase, partial [Bifidobacteriaceae bacterium]|jgi:glutamate N-acetyltransferase/amino-acid N-acetyltransferase|nr:bifunctional ornithine acetyltransferase/N-acetylglutamate synthase [Bifidobacteriaceae bacterium]
VVNDAVPELAAAAAVFTANRFAAAPVRLSQERMALALGGGQTPRAVVLNSGGANACTGPGGYQDAAATAQGAAAELGLDPAEVLVCSTGLIGQRLRLDALLAGLKLAAAALGEPGGAPGDRNPGGGGTGLGAGAGVDGIGQVGGGGTGGTGLGAGAGVDGIGQLGGGGSGHPDFGGRAAAEAIMTTDTVPKQALRRGAGGLYSCGGMAKGAGMLAPELATMLVLLTTDAAVAPGLAQAALEQACAKSFNRIDSDGCMSTNDAVILLASGASRRQPDPAEFTATLTALAQDLARQLVADAEGAGHEIAIEVTGALSEDGALAVARAVARSNLFKTAIAGNDPNWGRILAAAGSVSPAVAPYHPDKVDVLVNGVMVARAGGPGEPREAVDLTPREVVVRLDLHAGAAGAWVWTNDLTQQYVSINADYSS